MRRIATIFGALAVAAAVLTVGVTGPAQAATTMRIAYVVGNDQEGIGPPGPGGLYQPLGTSGVYAAPLGRFTITAPSTSITLNFTNVGRPPGSTIPVLIAYPDYSWQTCLPTGIDVTFRNVTPNEDFHVQFLGVENWLLISPPTVRCTGPATAGVVTLTA